MSDPTPVFDDLREESEELDRLVAELRAEQWALATPAPGWSVAHQIAHLAWTDHSALLAATDTDAFHVRVEKALVSPGSFVDDGAEEDRYAGTCLGKRELRALVAHPRLQVCEDPKAFLTCNHCSPGARNFQDLSGPAADRQDP